MADDTDQLVGALDPFALAALRQRRGVMPEGGRQAGPATHVLENFVPHAAGNLAQLLMAPGQALQGGDPTKGLSDESIEASIPKALGLASLGPMASAPGALAGAASVDPMLAALYLKRSGRHGINEHGHSWQDSHILDESGKRIGNLSTAFNPANKNVHVESVHTDLNSPYPKGSTAREANIKSHALGPAEIRSLVTALRAEYPEARSMTGYRTSGARDLHGAAKAEEPVYSLGGNTFNAVMRMPNVPQSAIDKYLQRRSEVEPLYHDPWGDDLVRSMRGWQQDLASEATRPQAMQDLITRSRQEMDAARER